MIEPYNFKGFIYMGIYLGSDSSLQRAMMMMISIVHDTVNLNARCTERDFLIYINIGK